MQLLFLLLFSSTLADKWAKHIIATEVFGPTTALAGDFNQDSHIDVISSSKGTVTLYQAPSWTPHVIHHLETKKAKCIHGDVLDVDQDGDLDVIMSTAKGFPFWLENPGNTDHLWTARLIDPDIRGVHSILTADVNLDSKPDVIINSFGKEGVLANSIAWFEVPSNPSQNEPWKRYTFAAGDAPGGSHYLACSDVNQDGQPDIAIGSKGAPFEFGNWFAYWVNPGKHEPGLAWEKKWISKQELGASNIHIADLNGDQKPDFLASNGHGQGVQWYEAPNWRKHLIDPNIEGPHSLAMADFDLDGDIDGATCSKKGQYTALYLNDGKGHFSIHQIDQGQSSYDLRAIDMDGDGDKDLLNAGLSSHNLVWYENPTNL